MNNNVKKEDLQVRTSDLNIFEIIWKFLKNNLGILLGLLVICIFLTITTSTFLTIDNIIIVLRQVSINAMVAFGMTYIIILGGIDLSVGGLIALSGITTTVMLARFNLPLSVSIIIGLISGIVIGLLNGLIIVKGKMPPFIVTLAIAYIARGLAYILSDGKPISVQEPLFNRIGNGYLGPIPYPIIYMFVVFIILTFILYRTKFGRHIYAIGGNTEAAKFSGIDVNKVQIISYTIIGFLSALGGIILSARLYSGQPTIGVNAELDVIAAVILGGTSFSGGIGTLGGTLIGAVVIGVINNGLNLLGVSSFWQLVAKGGVILIAVYMDMLRKNKQQVH
jgi:ribose transport system permease protein